jgi:glycosyltransferase involved in cell wall biosynthesis
VLKIHQFNKLIKNKKYQEALTFCEYMIESNPDFSFYVYWKNKLQRNYLNASIKDNDVRNSHLINAIKSKVIKQFSTTSYVVKRLDINSVKEPKIHRATLKKAFPFQGDIYLPTNKIPLDEQVIGMDAVSQLLKTENKKTSTDRFNKLKDIIKATEKKRIFVLGNGPSLKKTDLDLLKDEITIGFNGIFLHKTFKPTIHIVEDHLVAEDRVNEIVNFDCPVKIFPSYLGYCIPPQENTIFINHLPRKSFPVDTDFSDDVANISYTGGTVTYTGLQIAASLGFEEIILIGVDASYEMENVHKSSDYGTSVLESKSDDINHFDPTYFGKGFRWNDPNVHTMLQAYRKARNYAEQTEKRILNATIGGELDVFPRVNYWDLFNYRKVYPKTAIIDFTHIDWMCATGIVKKNMFYGWSKHSLFHVHGQNPYTVTTYQKIPNDLYAVDSDKTGVWAALRTLMEYNPDILYLRPTHDRPALSILQLFMPVILNKPFVIHYMDDWMAKIDMLKGKDVAELYKQVMSYLFSKANRVLTISTKMANFLNEEFGIPEKKLQVVHNYIQPSSPFTLPKIAGEKVIRYFGGMEPDMSLATIHNVAKAVDVINSNTSCPIKFEIYTGTNYLERYREEFKQYNHTSLQPQHSNYSVYLALLESSDLNVLCYNFDEKSKIYLKYSMANKLPENISSKVPFLAIGSEEIGTLSYLKEEEYPFIVLNNSEEKIVDMISYILFDKTAVSEKYFEVIEALKGAFSEEKNRCEFHNTLRKVAKEKPINVDNEEELLLNILEKLKQQITNSETLRESLSVMKTLLNLSKDDKKKLIDKIQSHGIEWQFKSIEAGITREDVSEVEKLAFLITSLEHERFKETNEKLKIALNKTN